MMICRWRVHLLSTLLVLLMSGGSLPAAQPRSYGGVTPRMTDETRTPDPLPSVPVEQASSQIPWKPGHPEWERMLNYYVTNNILPGVAVLIDSPNWGGRFMAAGKPNLEDPSVKFHPSTQFRIGSCSKIFIAVLILQLDAEHKLNLEDRIAKYLPASVIRKIHNGDILTILQCLDMTAGLYSYTNEEYLGEVTEENAMYDFTQEEILTITKNEGTLTTEYPGGTPDGEIPFYTYSNTGYLVCGLIAEALLKKPLEQLLKERIFDAIGITDTFFATDYRVTTRTARGYVGFSEFGFWIDCTRYNQDVPWAAGAVVSTPFDMVRFYRILLKTEDLLPKASIAKLLQMNYCGEHQGYGKGILEELLPTGASYGHGGTALGYLTAVFYYPERDFLYLQFCNTFNNKYTRAEICYRVMDYLLGACEEPVPAPGAQDVPLKDGSLRLAWHAGDYYGDEHHVYIGTDEQAVDQATPEKHDGLQYARVKDFFFEAKNLRSQTTYYWRVDAVHTKTDRELDAEQALINNNLGNETSYAERSPEPQRYLPGPTWSFRVQ